MHVYTVHEAPDAPADRMDRAERLVFVRDGFSLLAALVPPLWMLSRRLWLPAALYFAAAVLYGLLVWLFEIPERWLGLPVLAAHLLIGFEADGIARWALGRAGYASLGTVCGRSAAECERRFFDTWLAGEPMVAPSRLAHAGTGWSGSRRRWLGRGA
jgi:hypothetical protein